ncbi:MAG: hypothetical protein NZM10_00445, partial [Fimbriimonadales bacterium]|nr:hypothetical protein [Fimbriimonadales bacterium]
MLKRVQMFGIIAWLIVASLSSVFAQTFTFQGYLRDSSGNPINQPAGLSMTFTLFNHPSNTGAGFQVGSPITQSVPVRDGLFTVELNFGNVWDGSDRWLQIQIGSTTLIPRIKINPTPYAIRASTAGTANPIGSAGGDLSGAYPNPAVARLQGRAVSSAAPANGQVLKWDGSSWAPATDLSDTLWASSGGNIFNTNPGNVGIGTNTPSHKLEVNGDLLVNTSAGTLRVGFPSGANQWYLSTDGGGANLQLWENAANALRVYFRAGGNVGIGPFGAGSPPDYLLDVRGDRNARLMNIVNTNTGGFADGLYITVSGSTGWGLNSIANGADGIAVRGVASGANAWAGYFLGRGYFSDRVGIGTTSPGYILDVNGRARIRGATGTNSAGLWFSNGTNDRAFVGLVDDNTVGMWGQAGAGWHLTMRVDTGNVRIGPA